MTNARIGSVIGTVVKNAIPINGLKNNSPNAVGTYAMVSLCNDSQNREFIAVVVVEQQSGAIDSFELFDVAHAVSGRQKNSSQVDTKSQGVNPIKATTISIADLLNIVNSTRQSILSDNVLSHLGELRAKNGSFADKILFSDRVANPTEKEVDGKVPRANRASLIKTSTSDSSISQRVTTVNTNISEKSENSTEKYSDRDFPIDVDIEKTVSDAVKNRGKGGNHILSDITPEQNNAINRLAVNNDYYRGKFTGGKHFFTDNFINHALKEHGDFLVEGLRGQLPITNDDVARNLTAIRQNKKPSLTISSKTRMGNASILTVYKVNGYTLYAEEILRPSENNKVGNLIGHTMYKAPTLSTAAFNTTSVVTQPERQGTVLCEYNNTRKNGLSRGNFISDKAGNPAALKYVITERGIDFDVRSGLIALSSDEKNFTKTGETVETGYVLSNKPFYITARNTVFRNSEENYSTKVRELKKQGYDSFIFDYNTGDNYMVAVVNKAQIVTDKPAVVENERHSDRDITLSSRYLLANAFESTARNEVERDWLGRYKADIEKYNAEQDKLTTLKAQIKELSFGKGKRDIAKLRQLRNEKIKTGQYVIFDPEQVKSADLVTYDDEGNIIPLSERFRTDRTDAEAWKNEDIRYSARELDSDGSEYWQIESEKDIFRGINETSALRKAAYNFILHGDKGNKIFGLIDGKNLGNIGLLLFRTKKIPYGRQRLI